MLMKALKRFAGIGFLVMLATLPGGVNAAQRQNGRTRKRLRILWSPTE
jgi:hypothetical protein